tara:strand:+ start:7460 stop:8611 length:1152 start_codon:yes stop_codon:yes gene_type:complete
MKNIEIPFARPLINDDERNIVNDVLKGHVLTHGSHCKSFEKNFGNFHHSSYAVTLSNCTSALFLSLKFLNIAAGDEVIVPAMTHVATAHCVLHTGAKVIFADIENKTGNIDPNEIEKKISKKTKAIIIVHFVGLPCNIDRIFDIVKNRNISLIEDCAAALGAKFNDKLVGTFGIAGCFSFYPTKHITTMEGGMLISKNEKMTNYVKKISAFGYSKNFEDRAIPGIYEIDALGYNFRMSEVSAAIGNEQLKKLNIFNSKRRNNAKIIRNKLKLLNKIYILPEIDGKSISSNFCVNIILKEGSYERRNKIILKLKEKNIGTSVHYPLCLPLSNYYQKYFKDNNDNFHVAEHFANNTISLPCGPHLTEDDMDYMCNIITNVIKGDD